MVSDTDRETIHVCPWGKLFSNVAISIPDHIESFHLDKWLATVLKNLFYFAFDTPYLYSIT